MRFLGLLLLTGCEDILDPTIDCHTEYTRGGIEYRTCVFENGSAYIDTDYANVDCIELHGAPDCRRTAEVFLAETVACIQDVQDALETVR